MTLRVTGGGKKERKERRKERKKERKKEPNTSIDHGIKHSGEHEAGWGACGPQFHLESFQRCWSLCDPSRPLCVDLEEYIF